jgi:hypothetical protein
MKQRCCNPRHKKWADYGGRGITVCERWKNSFQDFFADMGDCPPGLSIHRVDNDGNYEPSNCVWATDEEQARVRRNVPVFTLFGVTACLKELVEKFGGNYWTIRGRLDLGWPIEKAFTLPPQFHTRFRKGGAAPQSGATP